MTGGCRWFCSRPGRLPKRAAIDLAGFILKRERQKLPVNIIITDDIQITKLNAVYRRRKHPTDVLAFPADLETGLVGEVYISLDTARRQAAEYKVPLRDEILRLVSHGVLHLCGYDHHRKVDADAMRARENEYLGRFTPHV